MRGNCATSGYYVRSSNAQKVSSNIRCVVGMIPGPYAEAQTSFGEQGVCDLPDYVGLEVLINIFL